MEFLSCHILVAVYTSPLYMKQLYVQLYIIHDRHVCKKRFGVMFQGYNNSQSEKSVSRLTFYFAMS